MIPRTTWKCYEQAPSKEELGNELEKIIRDSNIFNFTPQEIEFTINWEGRTDEEIMPLLQFAVDNPEVLLVETTTGSNLLSRARRMGFENLQIKTE